MSNSQMICIGVVLSAHGILGEIKVKTFTQSPQSFLNFKQIFNEKSTPLRIIKVRHFKNDIVILKLDNITDRNQSELLKGQKFYIQDSQLREKPIADDEVYYQDLVGLEVKTDSHAASMGKIIGVHNYGAGDLLELKLFDNGEEIFIPFKHQDVGDIHYIEKVIIVDVNLINTFRSGPKVPHD